VFLRAKNVSYTLENSVVKEISIYRKMSKDEADRMGEEDRSHGIIIIIIIITSHGKE
jgi:hypothetical protein